MSRSLDQLLWILITFDLETDEFESALRIDNLEIEEARSYLYSADKQDPMLHSYPIDTPELFSWISNKVHVAFEPERFAYVVEQGTERGYERMLNRAWENE